MGIAIVDNKTVVQCDVCGIQEETAVPNGVAPASWMTGQLWLDMSLTEQKQRAICFCVSCRTPAIEQVQFTIGNAV